MASSVAGIEVRWWLLHLYTAPHTTLTPLQVGMRALLAAPGVMARRDWRVAPIPWDTQLASPDSGLLNLQNPEHRDTCRPHLPS